MLQRILQNSECVEQMMMLSSEDDAQILSWLQID